MLGPVIIDLQGCVLSDEEVELLKHPLVGGVILFTRNYQSLEQLRQLTTAIHAVRSPQLLIVIDHEGGPVQRFHQDFTTLPPMVDLGILYAQDPTVALAQAEYTGYTMASELKAQGVDLSLAPVLDLNKGVSRVLADGRAISAEFEVVIAVAKAYIKGMHRVCMAATGKHFPGHGSVVIDSHKGIAVDERSLSAIVADDMQPFTALLPTDLQAVMPAHVIFPQVDKLPVSLSSIWLTNILRKNLDFNGMIMSDCLSMQGAAEIVHDSVERAALALNAGCDMILICNNRASVVAVLDGLHAPTNKALAKRIETMRNYNGDNLNR